MSATCIFVTCMFVTCMSFTCLSHDCHMFVTCLSHGVQVEELVRLSLNRPVRLFVDGNTDMARNLRQEFVRIKAKKESDREAIVTGEWEGWGS